MPINTILGDVRPPDLSTYKQWLALQHRVDLARQQVVYETNVSNVLPQIQDSAFWLALVKDLPTYTQEYQALTGYHLLMSNDAPQLLTKSFESALNKSFRKNVLQNDNWPNPPATGWVLPANWFELMNDIVRTAFNVKYLDGVEFLSTRLVSLADANKLISRTSVEARETGYYAYHLSVSLPCKIVTEDWTQSDINLRVELQITTQLQELMRQLTHKYYDVARVRMAEPEAKWQWDYRSEEFVPNYLGHILHYVEGMIMEVRDRERG